MYLGIGTFLVSVFPITISSYVMPLDRGDFTFTFPPIEINNTFVLETGIFTFTGGNLGIYSACGHGNIIDALATDAPYPPPDFFVPITSAAPTAVISPTAMFGPGSDDPNSAIYITYYNEATQTWNDAGYEQQYPGQVIPTDLKSRVSDQTYLYNEYITALALWQANYDKQKIFQWPYYWALNVSIAPGSIPGGSASCDCGNGIPLSPPTTVPATQTVLGGTGVSVNDTFDIGGTAYTVGQLFAMVLKNLAQP